MLDSSRMAVLGHDATRSRLRAASAPAHDSIAAIALGGAPRLPSLVAAAAWTALLYGGASLALIQTGATTRARSASAAAPHAPLVLEQIVELVQDPAEPPLPAAAPAEAPADKAVRSVVRPPPRAAAPATPPAAPAQAGQVLAADAEAQPLDFTSFDLATGDGPRYAGGVTASSGRSAQAAGGHVQTDGVARIHGGTARSLARSVRLDAREWDCPWPRSAETLGIDEQLVLLRVIVRADGSVVSARLQADPGFGFGEAALACARRSRFTAAADASGNAITAESPPIRVRFTRRPTK
jgi:periplasmic protein TonB